MVGIVFVKWKLVIIFTAILNREVTLCVERNGQVEFLCLWHFCIVLSSATIDPVVNIIKNNRSYKLLVQCRPTPDEIVYNNVQ